METKAEQAAREKAEKLAADKLASEQASANGDATPKDDAPVIPVRKNVEGIVLVKPQSADLSGFVKLAKAISYPDKKGVIRPMFILKIKVNNVLHDAGVTPKFFLRILQDKHKAPFTVAKGVALTQEQIDTLAKIFIGYEGKYMSFGVHQTIAGTTEFFNELGQVETHGSTGNQIREIMVMSKTEIEGDELSILSGGDARARGAIHANLIRRQSNVAAEDVD